ncbi:mechanosensitive ion channel domain-containing protein [Neolewinella antarctica]|uniref:Small-conductance mechanosensitive channel n=1 Tax=Neolewinella antarctica TaxID=442734 RepID=A0ABX0XDZ7_9BACT|nr:mechanosensitive ion channel domain-containing protein [Neolewinella antarctica]NJC27427.1 small-conductance mechanosensitive channel [Neolewinella antarctica]
MELYYAKIIESLIILVLYVLIRNVSNRIIDKTLGERLIQESRGIVIKKFISVASVFVLALFMLLVWGINQDDLAVFIGSVLTVLGIAFFAQWSILSNITSSIIIFFNHPVKFNDTILIMEAKDYVIEGRVTNIGLFFITLETVESEVITLPNNVFIQKSVKNVTNKSESAISTEQEQLSL